MILDILANHAQYSGISPRFARAFAFLQQLPADAALGRHEIDGDEVFAIVQQYFTKGLRDTQLEAHRKYIDIQYVLRGREIVYWAPLPLLTNVTMPFDVKADAALFGVIPEIVPLQLQAGQFAILFPADGHAPSCSWDQPAEVRKVVVKVKV